MKRKSSKNFPEELDYIPKLVDLSQLSKIIEDLRKEDKKEYFHYEVDKKGKIIL